MKIKTYKISGTIPTVEYGNITPELEMEGDSVEEMREYGIAHLKELYQRFSNKGLLAEKTPQSETEKIKSFNENVEIDFDRTNHIYWYKQNEKAKPVILTSATEYVSRFYPHFDSKNISKNCEKSWGVPAKDIQDMWSSNGKMTADFGIVIHQLLEHWFNYRDMGGTIKSNTERELNPALPKHPLLKKIIEDFEEIYTYTESGINEVFVSDVKTVRGGTIDRLLIIDDKNKVCRIQDYKVNILPENESPELKAKTPYNILPPNKLTKYQIQLSFYADMLKACGWTVEGLDVYVLEDGWKYYKLDIIDICGN